MSRIWFAIALGVALAAGVVLVLTLSGGGEQATAAAAPPTCLKDWNRDDVALEAGRHNRAFHNYQEAQVGYLDPTDGGEATIGEDPVDGLCTAVFPSAELDSEPEYAGFVLDGGRWASLTEVIPAARVGLLQAVAQSGANAELTADGELVAR
jgi:hypothetical protein